MLGRLAGELQRAAGMSAAEVDEQSGFLHGRITAGEVVCALPGSRPQAACQLRDRNPSTEETGSGGLIK